MKHIHCYGVREVESSRVFLKVLAQFTSILLTQQMELAYIYLLQNEEARLKSPTSATLSLGYRFLKSSELFGLLGNALGNHGTCGLDFRALSAFISGGSEKLVIPTH